MHIRLISIVLLMPAIVATSGLADVVINEVGIDELGGISSQWIELYNNGDTDVDISSWLIVPLSDRTKEEFVGITNITAKGFYVLTLAQDWMNPWDEMLILKNEEGNVVDQTPVFYEFIGTDCVWGRYPDGSNNWLRLSSSQGGPSTGEPCDEEKSSRINFNMDQRVDGSGYVRIRNVMHNVDKEYIRSRESGSGTYRSEEASKYNVDLNSGIYTMDLTKSNLSTRYSNINFTVTPERSIKYSSRWHESSSCYGGQDSPSFCESHMEATRLDSDVAIRSNNYALESRISSDYYGVGRIKSDLSNFKTSEEYAGSFKIMNDYHENISDDISISVSGEGFVSTDKKIRGRAYTYEKGTGAYQLDELIDVSNVSTLNISKNPISKMNNILMAKKVSLHHAPANHSYARVASAPMSITWKEGTGSGDKEGAFMRSDFTDLTELEAETLIISENQMRTSARFDGRARLKAGYVNNSSDLDQGFVFIDEEYVGNFSINRGYKVYPEFNNPHMSIRSQGRVDSQDCSTLRYIITLVNDGNRPLGPVFVRTRFPSGTSYLDSSIRPFGLSSREANWSISDLSIGESYNINLDLKIVRRMDNYISSSRAVTVYQSIRSYNIKDDSGNITVYQTSSDRRLSASNTTLVEADWGACGSQNVSITYIATPNSRIPNILTYSLRIDNQAKENMTANITVAMPPGIRFINSSSKYEQPSESRFKWTVSKLNAGRRRSVTFMAEAENEGYYVSNASVTLNSLDGQEIAAFKVIAPVIVGKKVYQLMPTAWQDWCPCDEYLLGRLSWNATSVKSGNDLGCVC